MEQANFWWKRLQIGDTVDIENDGWKIGTVVAISPWNTTIKITNERWYDHKVVDFDDHNQLDLNEARIVNEIFGSRNNDEDEQAGIQHNQLRKVNTFTPRHYDKNCDKINRVPPWYGESYFMYCDICNRKACITCMLLNIVITTKSENDNRLRYHCKDCEFSRRYNELFVLTKFMYDSILKTDVIEINIIYLITNYAKYYDVKCCKQLNTDTSYNPCHGNIEIKMNYDDMTVDKDIVADIEGVLCVACTKTKQKQVWYDKCRIYHEYDGNEDKHCIVCDELICNRCLRINQYKCCNKCGDCVCIDCDDGSYVPCDECKITYCGKCIGMDEENELFTACERCNDSLCNDCVPCCCQYQNVNTLDTNNPGMLFKSIHDDMSDESDTDSARGNDPDGEEMVVVD